MTLPPRTEPRSTVVPEFVAGLHRFGDAVALTGPFGTLTYRDLDARVTDVAAALAGNRRLVLIVGSNDPETIAAYLGALRAGHAVLLAPSGAPAGAAAALTERYDPRTSPSARSTAPGACTYGTRQQSTICIPTWRCC